MIKNWRQHLSDTRAEQCPEGTKVLIEMVKELQPKVYVETGCAHLGTFQLFHSMLPKDGFAIGIDLDYSSHHIKTWEAYDPEGYCPHALFRTSTGFEETADMIDLSLSGRKIDMLFIDGDHNEKGVKDDWEVLGPHVRSGGLVVLHDYDPGALRRGRRKGQGAAILANELAMQGYVIKQIKNASIGTAYFYKP